MFSVKNLLLMLAFLSFITIIGAGVYEHVAIVPHWAAAPPASLSMFQGKYGVNPGPFWMSVHPVTVLLFISALIANWKTPRRKFIMWPFIGYIIVLIITNVYFVPELLSIIKTPYQDTVDTGLQQRADMWEALSIGRAVVLVAMALTLLSALVKPVNKLPVL